MAELYADEDFPGPVVIVLRSLGYDVLTAHEDGRAGFGIDDPEVLERATELGRAVLTHNRDDYRYLHDQDPQHDGIITCTRDKNWAALAARIHAAIVALPSLHGHLIKIIRPSS